MRKVFRIARSFGEDRGDSMVEFSIAAVLLLTVIFGIMDFARAVYADHFVSYAAQEGTRYAIVRGHTFAGTTCSTVTTMDCAATNGNVQSYVQSIAPPGIPGANVSATTTWPGNTISGSATGCSNTNNPGCIVRVTVTYNFSFLLPFMPSAGISFSSTSSQVIQE